MELLIILRQPNLVDFSCENKIGRESSVEDSRETVAMPAERFQICSSKPGLPGTADRDDQSG